MSDKRIIFPTDDGGVAVITPAMNNCINDETGEWLPLYKNEAPPEGYRMVTVEDIAAKDVPPYVLARDENGVPTITEPRPFEIIDASDLPDRSTRNAWEWTDGN